VTKTGYTFTSWSPTVPETVGIGNATYTAQWRVNNYDITFNANGGTGGTGPTSMQYGDALTPPAVAKTGYTLSSWSPAVPPTVGTGNTTYTAQWDAKTFTVTFDAQGGSVSPATSTVAYDSTYGEGTGGFTTPTRTGYTFDGWYTGTLGTGTMVTSDTVVTLSNDQTLHANWIKNNVAVIGVTLDKTSAEIYQFATVKLTETVTPADATDKSVTWSSSDENIATVDGNGLVTAIAPGTAVITVTTNDGGKTATCDLTVKKPIVTVTIVDGKLNINIKGWNSNYSYQIWTYQNVESDIFLDGTPDVRADQWILSGKYTFGSSAIQEPDGSISFQIDLPATAPDGNYTVSIKVQDADGHFMGDLTDSYTPEQIGFVTISKVLVDGQATYSNETKETKAGATVALKIIASNADYYSISINGVDYFPNSTNNEFIWNIQYVYPGSYTLVFTALNTSSGSSFKKTVVFKLYSRENLNYGIINSMVSTVKTEGARNYFELEPQLVNGDYFYYTIGEQGRTPSIRSGMLAKTTKYTEEMGAKRIGIYEVFGYITRASSVTYDDGIQSQVIYPRTGGPLNMSTFLNGTNTDTLGNLTCEKGTEMNFSAIASISNLTQAQIEYSYWRYDALGFVLIKDWSSSNTLAWTPARAGTYSIQVRAKGVDAGSYEVAKSLEVKVSNADIAHSISVITNSVYLNANAQARIPIVITADATDSSGEPLLYKFYAYDNNLGTTMLQQFSPLQSCEWTPRKAGTYKISILVKNEASFGKYDAMETFTVNVE
ncbi:MAG: Ig-like domain-containing protein, partial [Eubacteriales bacterium]